MDPNDDVVYRCMRLGPLDQRHPGRSRSLARHHDRFHLDTSLRWVWLGLKKILRLRVRAKPYA
jgi:hypothetical protein